MTTDTTDQSSLHRYLAIAGLGLALFFLGNEMAIADKAPAADVAVFLTRVDAFRQDKRIPGLSIAIVKDQKILLAAGLGWADLEQQITATASTPYNIASVTKPISAVAVMKLVEQELIDLDRPIAQYSRWQDFCDSFSQQPSIFARELVCDPANHSLRQLLSHTAGGAAGSHFSYNPVVYSWASRPVMAVARESFSRFVTDAVLVPAAMSDSARHYRDLPLREDLARRLAPPHRIAETGQIVRADTPPPQVDGAAGGIIATALDLARFDIALDRGELITAKSRELMMEPTLLQNGKPAPYGLGWYVQEYQGLKLVWHSGWWENAYSALYLKIPSHDLSLIALANSEGIHWGNPLDRAQVQNSRLAQIFLAAFVTTE